MGLGVILRWLDKVTPGKSMYQVTYLCGFGATRIFEHKEFYVARSQYGAWCKFMETHNWDPGCGYQSNFSLASMREDIQKV